MLKYLRLILIMLMSCAVLNGWSQATAQTTPYKFDFGVNVGMSGYIGEANRGNLMAHPGFTGELTFRYLPDTRWAVRGMLYTLGLKGDTRDMTNVLPDMAEFSFTSQVYGLDARAEFNFFPYGIGETYKRLRRWTPYLTIGVGAALGSCGGSTTFAPTIPMGVGVKFKLKERINLGVEFTMTKSFGDKFDGPDLADVNQIKTSFYKNTDWFSRLTVGISYEFGKRCETCHYVD